MIRPAESSCYCLALQRTDLRQVQVRVVRGGLDAASGGSVTGSALTRLLDADVTTWTGSVLQASLCFVAGVRKRPNLVKKGSRVLSELRHVLRASGPRSGSGSGSVDADVDVGRFEQHWSDLIYFLQEGCEVGRAAGSSHIRTSGLNKLTLTYVYVLTTSQNYLYLVC